MLLTLTGNTPPARFDNQAWVSARIEEGDTETGSFTEVETIALTFVDADPRYPAPRGLTTELASADKFYRIVWIDADGTESEPTAPEQALETSVTEAFVTRDELALLLKVDPTANSTALDRVLLAAAGEIRSCIGEGTLVSGWKLALCQEVNLERASEHWVHQKSPFGFVGLEGGESTMAAVISHKSWERHADKLAPLIREWGIA